MVLSRWLLPDAASTSLSIRRSRTRWRTTADPFSEIGTKDFVSGAIIQPNFRLCMHFSLLVRDRVTAHFRIRPQLCLAEVVAPYQLSEDPVRSCARARGLKR